MQKPRKWTLVQHGGTTEFENIMASGGSWGVYMTDTEQGNIVTIVGTYDPNAYCAFVGSVSTGWYQCVTNPGYGYVNITYFTHNSYGGNGCIGSFGDRCSDTGMNVYGSPHIQYGTAGYTVFAAYNTTLSDYQFFFMNFDSQYPNGYEGKLIPTAPPVAKYVAMGDSYSTAEGNPSFEAGTGDDGTNECHRSPQAYPRLLQNRLNLGPTAFVACSGATTNDMLGISEANNPVGKWNEPAQIDALSDETEVVTITIGGNNVKFKEFAEKCVSPLSTIALDEVCDEYTPIYDEVIGLITNSLPAELRSVYASILTRAPNAEIYVGGYPRIAPFKYIAIRLTRIVADCMTKRPIIGVMHERPMK
ncbi:MAG TPA: SGNH/GDSL hydrolase family protein [Candidatus Saccharimonadales bacterium]|nr:SGNH/GDSL hydrolase family protein [Candidatus Saccharimonadales bacterium]